MNTRVSYTLTGKDAESGGPTLDDVIALYRALTGREPSEDDLARARETLAKRARKA